MNLTELCLSKVAGVVTLYNSEPLVLSRIGTYMNQLSRLYIVDNSDKTDVDLVNSIIKLYPTAKLINNYGNKGIANALNVGASAALQDKYEYLLMMDDDSEAPDNLVEELFAVMAKGGDNKIGIVAAQSDPNSLGNGVKEVITVITSGSLLSLDAYKEVGPFTDDLFIDWVDHEYCFRLRKLGYLVLIANQVQLKHRLGVFKEKILLGVSVIKWRSHNPVRLYYKFRNSLCVISQYRKQLPFTFTIPVYYELFLDLAKVIFLEQNKRAYISFIRKGILDAYRHRLGKHH